MKDYHKKNQTFKGFEAWFINVEMNFKMYFFIFLFFAVIHFITATAISMIWYFKVWKLIIEHSVSAISSFEIFYFFTDLAPLGLKLIKKSIWVFILPTPIWLFLPAVIRQFKVRAEKQADKKYEAGAIMIDADNLKKEIQKDGEQTDIPIGNIRMPISAEPKHCFLVGRPGAGKTVAISAVINCLRRRDAKAIIYDFKGDFVSKFFDPQKDILFNPLDQRCQGWNVFNELSTFMDIDAVAHSLIPPANNADPFWNDSARDVFSGILHFLYQNGLKTNADIWTAVTAPGKDIASWLKKTRGGERGFRYLEDSSSKQSLSVLAVMMQYAKAFEFMAKADGDFSIRPWLEDDKGGFIFITNHADVKSTLRPILSLFIDLFGRKVLGLKDDYNRRIFFMLDELGTLQRLSTIVQLLTLSRSKGGSCWLGIQDIGQLDKIYSEPIRQAIVNACGSNLIFSVNDPVTAKFLSDKIGDVRFFETEENLSMGAEDIRDGINLVRRKRTEKLILPADIQKLKDLEAYIKFPNFDYSKVKLDYVQYSDKHELFLMKPDFNLDTIIEQMQAISEEETEDAEEFENENRIEIEK